MLPQTYKFHAVNKTGAAINVATSGAENAITVDVLPWNFDSNGALVYAGSEVAAFAATGDIVDDGTEAGSAQDNSSNLYLGLHGKATAKTNGVGADGTVDIYYEYATDGSTFPSDAANVDVEVDLSFLGSITIPAASEEHSINFEI